MGSPHYHLRALVHELFATNTTHLRSVLTYLPGGERLLAQLPERGASPAEFIDQTLDELQRHGLVEAALGRLGDEFPVRRREIEQVAAITQSVAHEPAAHSGELQDYLARIRERCRFITPVGLGSPLQVQLPIDGFYVPLRLYLSRSLEGREVPGRFDPEELARGELVTKDVPLEDVLSTARRFDLRGVVLLGDAGAGKTTAARYIAWLCAQSGGARFGLAPEVVPMLLSFRHCRPEYLTTGLATWCSQEWSSPHAPELQELVRYLVAHGPILWIFDGLDEISSASGRAAASQWIHQAMLDRPGDSFIITSRYAGYTGDPLLRESFLELHLQPLDVQQSQAFIRQWYRCVEAHVRGADPAAVEIAEHHSAVLIASLDGRDLRRHQLGVVATNPLLLSILCLVHRRTADASLRRADLYRQCVDVLLGHWLTTKCLTAPAHDDAYRLLSKLAWVLHRTGTRTDLAVEDAAALFSDHEQALLRCIRDECGLVVTSRPGHHAFLHLTFQEFFAAVHVHEHEAASSLLGHFEEAWWREVILLFSGMATPEMMHAFVSGLLQTDALENQPDLFAQCLDAADPFPLAPLLEQLTQVHNIGLLRLRGLLRLVRGQDSPQLRALCETLLNHEDGGVIGLAKEILTRSSVQRRVDVVSAPEVTARASLRELEFVAIPGGEVTTGCPRGHANEYPRRSVLVPFRLCRYPVTNAQYRRFLEANPGAPLPRYWADPRLSGADQPVVGVSWFEAMMFCAWAGVRLPSECEWEAACRAGTRTAYWSGDDEAALRNVGWYQGNAGGRLHAVGELPANPYGLHDMHGSVWEWCADWYAHELDGTVGGKERVLRGGYWNIDANRARSSYRGRLPPRTRGFDLGFRVAALR